MRSTTAKGVSRNGSNVILKSSLDPSTRTDQRKKMHELTATIGGLKQLLQAVEEKRTRVSRCRNNLWSQLSVLAAAAGLHHFSLSLELPVFGPEKERQHLHHIIATQPRIRSPNTSSNNNCHHCTVNQHNPQSCQCSDSVDHSPRRRRRLPLQSRRWIW